MPPVVREVATPAAWLTAVLVAAAASAQAQTASPFSAPADSVDPGLNRLFFAPTGRTLPAGTAEFGAYMLVAPYVGYAFFDRFMLAAGTPIVLGSEDFARYWYVAPKVGVIAAGDWSAAIGGLLLLDLKSDILTSSPTGDRIPQSLLWGVVTYGSRRAAVTVGGVTSVEAFDGWIPLGELAIVGGEIEVPTRGSATLRLIAESYWEFPFSSTPPWDSSLNAIGVRFNGDRAAVEVVGLVALHRWGVELSQIPFVHFSVLF